jgi:NAD(P)-dependent dehydrogenase (short-subunit alcohol dehydrogenase family)
MPVPGCAVLLSGAAGARNLERMPTTLITGANKGLGYEAARRLLAAGHDVWVTARDRDRGLAAADALGARFVQLDVTDDASVATAADHVAAETGLDVLVNNAGIVGARVPVERTTAADLRAVCETNVFGIVRVLGAFVPLLARSENPVVVNVSSGMGSLGVTSDADRIESRIVSLAYASSKTAVNMLTSQYAKAYPQIHINAVDPGYTATDFNGHSGFQSVEEGTDAIVRMASIDATGPTGAFVDRHGNVPW